MSSPFRFRPFSIAPERCRWIRPTHLIALALLLPATLLCGCSLRRAVVVGAAVPILEDGVTVFQRESDTRLAREAIPANLKLLEILLSQAPDDARLNALAAEYMGTYVFAFVEPDVEMYFYTDPARSNEARRRAIALYERGKGYGFKALSKHGTLQSALEGGDMRLAEDALARVNKDEIRALFWTAFCWAAEANLNLDKLETLTQGPAIEAMMKRVLELDETYYYGGAHLFFGTLLASLPETGGGDPKRSREHFRSAMACDNGCSLMAKVFYARYYAVRVQDVELFRSALREVLEAPIDQWPNEILGNRLAQDRARFYLDHESDYFLETNP